MATRKRPLSTTTSDRLTENDQKSLLCDFCQLVPGALMVDRPVRMRIKKRAPTPFCLSCYYTTSAVRENSKYVSILNQTQLDLQLPAIQALFGEVYVELRKELAEESERSFQKQKSDPLAMLHQTHQRAPPRRSFQNKKAGKVTDGGFLRQVKIPERLLKTQALQAQKQRAQIERMNQSAKSNAAATATSASAVPPPNLFQRRKASRKSIWNLAMEEPSPKEKRARHDLSISGRNSLLLLGDAHNTSCSCGSKNVRNIGNTTSRNQDMRKGETWGMKDRGDDVVTKYQCNDCGKMWQEAE